MRHPTADFFICDVLDVLPKDDLATMEHPVFSLATRPDRRVLWGSPKFAHRKEVVEPPPQSPPTAVGGLEPVSP